MGRIVYCPLPDLSVTNDADQDIWELATPATHHFLLHGWELTSASEVAEVVTLRLLRGTASGSVGGAGTEVNADEDAGTLVGVVETLNTTPGTDGAILQTFEWEQLGPVGMIYTPEMRILMQESGFLKLNLETALGATTVWNGWLCWEEL